MTARGRARPAGGAAASVIGPLVAANVGVLSVFLFGPNTQHPILLVAYAGAAVAVAGAVALVRALAIRRRKAGDSMNASGR
jgi:Na+-translocating ferredoxin:NAD+ oxidoreductase RnfA subunit